MSMPEFPKSENILTKEQAISAILTSIAMEEIALSHIINAESEKIKYVTERVRCGCNKEDIQQLLKVNESVTSLIEQITDMQIILKNKLRIAAKYLPHEDKKPCPQPCLPPVPKPCSCCSCKNECTSLFSAEPKFLWLSGTSLCVKERLCCENGVKLCNENCGSMIFLPGNRKYKIELNLELAKISSCPVSMIAEICHGCNIVNSKELVSSLGEKTVRMAFSSCIETLSSDKKSFFYLKLNSPESLKVINGIIEVTQFK